MASQLRLITDQRALLADSGLNGSPVDADTMSMPPPRVSPLEVNYDGGSGLRRPRSDSFGHLSRSGNLTSRQSFEAYPSLHTSTPPDLTSSFEVAGSLGSGRSPNGAPAAMFISPAFRTVAQQQCWGGEGENVRDNSESPARTATPSEDVFQLDWDNRSVPDPPSKHPPPSPKPQSFRWTDEHEHTVESRRRRLEENSRGSDVDSSDEDLGSQVGRFTVSHRMELDDHVTLPSAFTSAPPQPSLRRRPSLSTPCSPVKSSSWLSRCQTENMAPLSLDDLGAKGPAASPSMVNPYQLPHQWDSDEWSQGNQARAGKNVSQMLAQSPGSPCASPGGRPTVISTVQQHAVRFHETFEELGSMHSGPSSQVFRCKGRLDQWLYAVKRSAHKIPQDLSPAQTRTELNEVYALSALSGHPQFVRHFSCWVDQDAHLYTQLEYCRGGTLAEQVCSGQEFTERSVLYVLRQVASGLQYLHGQGLAHRTLSTSSLFVTESGPQGLPTVKIGHLRLLARYSNLTEALEVDWTHAAQARAVPYVSIEALRPGMPAQQWPLCDMFALGMVLFDLATAHSLPQELEDPEWSAIRNGAFPALRPGFSQEFSDLVGRLLLHQFTADHVLEHPMVRDIEFSTPEHVAAQLLSVQPLELEVEQREYRSKEMAKELKTRAEFDSLLRQYISGGFQKEQLPGS